MNEPDFLLINREYLREMARQVTLAHQRSQAHCPCEFCAHGRKMGIPLEELPGT